MLEGDSYTDGKTATPDSFFLDIHSPKRLAFLAISEQDTPQSDGFSVPLVIQSSLLSPEV